LASAFEARRHTAWILRRHGLEHQVPAFSLLVSELVTNAIMHACPPYALVIDIESGSVRVSVEDGDLAGAPRVNTSARSRSRWGGHGLRIVEQLAADWGCEPAWCSDGHDRDAVLAGKTVWFTIDSPPEDR
jgi:anti-sigma regulatory factor (Ser/Thr protein kinase)